MAADLPLPAQLSAAFVALAIEIDNAAESQIAHHTTSSGGTGQRGTVWLASIAMWFNAIRALIDVDELTVAQVRRRTGLGTNVDGLRRWGYVTVNGFGDRLDGQKRPIPKPSSVLRLTSRGRQAAAVWAPLSAAVEHRWRGRFGGAAVDRLRAALSATGPASALPEYLPILGFDFRTDRDRRGALGASDAGPAADTTDSVGLPLISLLARVLIALTLEYEADATPALPVWADGLRLLGSGPTPVRGLASRAGVGEEAMKMVLHHLVRVGCAELTAIADGRGKQVRLTARGEQARSAGARRLAGLGRDLAATAGSAVDELTSALEPLVGDGSQSSSPLFAGLHAVPGSWRADIAPSQRLPWYPLVLHRGGYPDGN